MTADGITDRSAYVFKVTMLYYTRKKNTKKYVAYEDNIYKQNSYVSNYFHILSKENHYREYNLH